MKNFYMSHSFFLGLLIFQLLHTSCILWRRRRRPPSPCTPLNCGISEWTSWGPCSQSCGLDGTQSRVRKKLIDELCDGKCPYHLHDLRRCNLRSCKDVSLGTEQGGAPWEGGGGRHYHKRGGGSTMLGGGG